MVILIGETWKLRQISFINVSRDVVADCHAASNEYYTNEIYFTRPKKFRKIWREESKQNRVR